MQEKSGLQEKLQQLKEQRNAVILAHNYQIEEIHDAADYVGDSLDLSQKAAEDDSGTIVFCGVHFMAESASLLAPEKTVLLPEVLSGCPLADMVTAEQLREVRKKYPGVPVVTYINSSAAVKAESDICCTSSNATAVVNSLEEDRVLFVPDKNLARFVAKHTEKEIIPWDGYCITHYRVTAENVDRARKNYPGCPVIVHPECPPEVTDKADEVLSTGDMVKFAAQTSHSQIIVGTEMGLLYRLEKENPGKEFFLLSPGLICPNMKYTTLNKVINSLENMETVITVPEDIRPGASRALEKMLQVIP